MVAALTDWLRRLLADGDGEGAQVVLRALEDLARLLQAGHATQATAGKLVRNAMPEGVAGKLPNVTSIERARRGSSKDGKTGR